MSTSMQHVHWLLHVDEEYQFDLLLSMFYFTAVSTKSYISRNSYNENSSDIFFTRNIRTVR